MKAKLIKFSKPLLSACMALGIFMGWDITSAIFLGEYQFPKEI